MKISWGIFIIVFLLLLLWHPLLSVLFVLLVMLDAIEVED